MPENTPFTAVLKFAAEEVGNGPVLSGHETCVCQICYHIDFNMLLQFKVPPATSAIITNGKSQAREQGYSTGFFCVCVCVRTHNYRVSPWGSMSVMPTTYTFG